MEREKPVISLGGQDKPDLSYMYGGAEGKVKPLCGTALMVTGPVASKHKPSAGVDSVTGLVDSGASGHYFDDLIILSLKHRLLNYVLLTTPRKILTAGGALLDGTAKGILQGLVTDKSRGTASCADHYPHWVWHRAQPFLCKSAMKKSVVFIFDFDNPRLELSSITVPLHAEDEGLYSLVFDVSADSHAGKEMAMSAMTNA